jgi:DNA invertase Pin-like site-specific DNA recombinase
MKFASYVRTSKGEKASDPTRQVNTISQWAERTGNLVTRRFEDRGGKRSEASDPAKRPGFHDMLAQAQDRRHRDFDGIVVEEATRFGTADVYEWNHYLYLLRRARVVLVEARSGKVLNADPDKMGEVLTSTVTAMAQTQEVVDKSSRSLGGALRKAAEGLWQGGPILNCSAVRCTDGEGNLRWTVEVVGGRFVQTFADGRRAERDEFPAHERSDQLRLVPSRDERNRTAIRMIYTLYDQGVGVPTIARRLNSEGMVTQTGGRWYGALVQSVLRRGSHFAGRPGYGKARRGKYHRRTEGLAYERVQDPGTYEYVPHQEWLIAPEGPGADAVISWELYQRVQQRLDARGIKRPRSLRNAEGWLSGLLHCAKCGARMIVWTNGDEPLRYGCGTYRRYGKDGCSCNSVRHDRMARLVERYLDETGQQLAGLEGDSLAPLFDQERKAKGYLGEIRLAVESYLYDRLASYWRYEEVNGYRIFRVKLPDGTRKLRLPDFSGNHELIEQALDHVETADQADTRAKLEAARSLHSRLYALYTADLPEMMRTRLLADIAEQERQIRSLEASLCGLGQQLREAVRELSELRERIESAREALRSEEAERRAEAVRQVIERIDLEFTPVRVGSQLQHHLKSATFVPHLGDEVTYEGDTLLSETTLARRR